MLPGIDISAYQTENIVRVQKPGFVMIEAARGTGYTNPYVDAQVKDAISQHIPYGLYYYSFAENIQAEIDHFLMVARPHLGKAILALDWEGTAIKAGQSYALEWLDTLSKNFPGIPLIYGSYSWMIQYHDIMMKYPLWQAAYSTNGNPGPAIPWGKWKVAMRQYTDSKGELDRDTFYGTASDWAHYADTHTTPQQKDEEMDFILAQDAATKSQGTIYRIITNAAGVTYKVPVTPVERIVMNAWASASGDKERYAVAQVSAAQLNAIPNV